ncbi:FAS1-like dehydratase domain-containing protein [Pseudomonas marginalis]|uniref:FAS1-like dehydratase domain-containing protein n=1 Tax=Pseudomonas marginalis TaxID=298 RepID=UPI002B1CB5AF|nr:MaoC family dehydratase N-terminal domain-containing protein [Pseudomonas marginalis]
MSIDIEHLKSWIGRQEHQSDRLTPVPMTALAATLEHEPVFTGPEHALPELWHWLYFLPLAQQSAIGDDGHPRRGGFLPPIELPRRMWAGGRLEFLRSPLVGSALERTSTILDVTHKSGRSGELVFVTLEHQIADSNGVLIREEQDLVYRDHPQPGTPLQATEPTLRKPLWSREITPDPVLLFRYSALTFNGHRIHYDRPYAQAVEGYPGLVVHGPLIATLLVDLFHRQMPGVRLKHFSFRAMRPLFDTAPITLCALPADNGATVLLWAQGPDGEIGMEATATLA